MKNIAIKEHHLYNKTFSKGKRFVGRYVAVYVLRDLAAERLKKENPQKTYVNRLGLSVSKKLGGAVQRNRAKRLMRASYDKVKNELRRGNLIVISPRNAILSAKSTEVADELSVAFCELGLKRRATGEEITK
ncbi:MAG: ribonuclease P protein component [Clostridia bacterium]|nr:ribonuclease P protein component [Clostridia bacterium]